MVEPKGHVGLRTNGKLDVSTFEPKLHLVRIVRFKGLSRRASGHHGVLNRISHQRDNAHAGYDLRR